jgi:D-beta-D-heptose 7-phosphate kinase/D-beta-D-heptose 1-phosphate adenosyltransferase
LTPFDPRRKILSRDEAVRWRAAQSGRVVFTNGVFDLLHPGHVDLLRQARERGQALIVGVNTDESVRRLKGPARPVCPAADRVLVLAALETVDAVVLFGEDTPLELVRLLRPDVIVKGGDYRPDTVVGAADVLAAGGEVVIVPLVAGRSTSTLVERLRGEESGGAA